MEENQNAVTQTEEKTEVSGEKPVEKNEKDEVKTFTQDEVNAMLAKEKKKMPSKEDLKAFNEWKESQKTESEKQLEKDKKIEALEKQLTYAENKSVVANAGVDSKFQKFVLSEVSEMEGEFEDNLKDYLKENPQFLISKVETPKTNGVATKKIGNEAESGVTAILKAKHPDIDF
ncbi:MAG TPA: hypothetical protein IAB27_03645 [Candidatus Coprosoma intestinipullorum]|uniref:DUF4355 domain-containing protein n=1 Tax=Candidatus Coprosoma intestinipullorum TaxID=2840752 RepID=A0A9D0ZQC5_9FIRM|nr:hypothetical protein [Candidatus Coprosoma intestinipullorum]